MNKAYLLMLCLLSTSFVGCLDTDEDETLEPLGTDENNESSYDDLEAEIKNLTKEIEKLREDIKSLESYQYNPPENSILYFNYFSQNTMEYELYMTAEKSGNNLTLTYFGESPYYVAKTLTQDTPWLNNTNCQGNQTNQNNSEVNDDCDNDGVENYMDNCPLTANNNQKDSDNDGIGDVCDSYPNTDNNNAYSPCTNYAAITIYNSRMDTIREGNARNMADGFERNCVVDSQYLGNNSYSYDEDGYGMAWTKVHFSLKEEPVRIEINSQILTF
mgnify:FL=1